MRKLVIVILLACSTLAFAQKKPAIPKEPTVSELKLQLAQKDFLIAQLKLQLIQAQAQIAYQNALIEVSQAKKAVEDFTPKESKK